MEVPVQAKITDLFFVLLNRGTGYILVATLFLIASWFLSANELANLGFWWSIAIAIGGVCLGALGPALLREMSLFGQINHAKPRILKISFAMLSVSLLIFLSSFFFDTEVRINLQCLCLSILLGFAIQMTSSFLTLIRVHLSVRKTAIPTLMFFACVWGFLILSLWQKWTKPEQILSLLLLGHLLALAFAIVFFSRESRHIQPAQALQNNQPSESQLVPLLLSMTLINLFSYGAINGDVSIFKFFASSEKFTEIALLKIFFERYFLPILILLNSTYSMALVRSETSYSESTRFQFPINGKYLFINCSALVAALIGFYWNASLRGITPPHFSFILSAMMGYFLYSLNGLLFDMVALKSGSAVRYTAFVTLFFMLILWVLSIFLVPQLQFWSVGWFIFNFCIFLVLKYFSRVKFVMKTSRSSNE